MYETSMMAHLGRNAHDHKICSFNFRILGYIVHGLLEHLKVYFDCNQLAFAIN